MNNMKKANSFAIKNRDNEFKVPVGRVEDEIVRKYQLSNNEIDELRTSLYYVEDRLSKELNVKEELVSKAEEDRRALIDCKRKLKDQEDLNRIQAKRITALSDQLNDFVQNQDNIVKHLKDKFEDYNREMRDKDEKIRQFREQLMDVQTQLMVMTKERDRFLKELDIADEKLREKDEYIKRITTDLNLAEKTIEQFINWKERDISSFFDDDTIYTDPKKIESILTNMDDTRKEISKSSKLDLANSQFSRPYMVQKLRQEEQRQKELQEEMEKEPNLKKLPEEVRKIVESYRTKHGQELDSRQVDWMLMEINKAYADIRNDKIAKVKLQTNSEIQYLKRVLSLLIPLDKDKARTEIAYLRSELKRAREDIRRLNIIIRRKFKGAANVNETAISHKPRGTTEDLLNDISTEDDMYKSNSRFIENALSVAENAVNETKGLSTKVNSSISNFKNKKQKNHSTWREEDEPEDMLSEEWLVSEINAALKDSNQNVKRMMYASRLHLANSGMQLLK